MGTQMSAETGAQERDMATVRIPISLPFRNCGNDKSGSFAEAEAYHSFSEASAAAFQPTRPCGTTLLRYGSAIVPFVFQPTRPARGATRRHRHDVLG